MSLSIRLFVGFFLGLIALPILAAEVPSPLRHDLQVKLEPAKKRLQVRDTITLPQPSSELTLDLHAGLSPAFHSDDGPVISSRTLVNKNRERYRLKLPMGSRNLRIDYGGIIYHALSSSRAEQSRGFRRTAGLIDAEGVFLAAGSLWYPQIDGYSYLVYSLDIEMPGDWSSVSQGTRQLRERDGQMARDRWVVEKPQEEIYLIAAAFTEYSRSTRLQEGEVAAQVFLRDADPKLAAKYLDATVKYLRLYEKLLGPYAYGKFALVENFWETGFGMPSFTLLGSRVIRLPFIINSSYPHEILHNWWGNGVYVDFASGNWSEGLTAYLADHLIKEQQGQGARYRQQSLQKYRDYAAKNRDFPLSQFKSRHSSATEAVGYGKTLMLFHMLRKKIGDELFKDGLQHLYRDYRFRLATFDDVQQAFEQVSGQSLARFFRQWVERTGAPELVLSDSKVESTGQKGFRLELAIKQVQPGEPYMLEIPVAVSLDGRRAAHEVVVHMTERQQTFSIELPAKPTRVDIDPQFDLFRELAIAETPPAFTELFGSNDLLVVLPHKAPADLRHAWQAFARDLSHMGPERVEQVWDRELDELPADKAIAVLGWRNRFVGTLQQDLGRHPVSFASEYVRVGSEQPAKKDHAFAWVTRHGSGTTNTYPRALITADLAVALPGLGRKLPHYHRYSYLAFEGEEPQNRLKGRWPVTESPMSLVFAKGAPRARLAPQSALIDPVSPFDAGRMMQSVRFLADTKLQGRGLGSLQLERAADYIASAFKDAGLEPGGNNGSYFQTFSAVGEDGRSMQLKNVIGIIPGRHPRLGEQNLVFGAHYDHLGLGWPDVRKENRGKVHHGADDNASGIAVMLELARILGGHWQPDRDIVFVAFSGEEAGRLGSKHYVKHMLRYPVERSIGMLNLDSVGRLFDRKLIVLGAESASEWPHIFRGIGFVTGIESAMVSEPLDASDQISFHEVGVPAVQLFSGAHPDYHRPTDTAEKIDAAGLVKVAEVSRQVLEYLAGRQEAMTSQLGDRPRNDKSAGGRKVSFGSIPDFTYQGKGYRLDGVVADSPAERAGLGKGDVVLAVDDAPIGGIRDFSRVLKALQPGQDIQITYRRGGERLRVRATLDSK